MRHRPHAQALRGIDPQANLQNLTRSTEERAVLDVSRDADDRAASHGESYGRKLVTV